MLNYLLCIIHVTLINQTQNQMSKSYSESKSVENLNTQLILKMMGVEE